MGTIREYFDTDARVMGVTQDLEAVNQAGERSSIRVGEYLDFDSNARYISIYVPDSVPPFEAFNAILGTQFLCEGHIAEGGSGIEVTDGFAGYPDQSSSATMRFTGRMHLYIDASLTVEERASMRQAALAKGLYLVVRDTNYAAARSTSEVPLAFISHDSRDKDDLVRGLAKALVSMRCPVWYDEFSLTVGDSLRESIEKGLRECKKCILVLSPNFFANNGWTRAEYDSVFTRERVEKQKVILPVWHGVTVEQVYTYSPLLADRVGLSSTLPIDQLASKLAAAARKP